MGHCWSRETADVNRQVQNQGSHNVSQVYKLVDLNNGGELVELCREATRTGDFSKLDARIQKLSWMMYYEGLGCHLPLGDIISYRDGKLYKSPCSKFHPELYAGDKIIKKMREKYCVTDGSIYHLQGEITKFTCWRLDKRGTVGETILHLCFLNTSTIHANLAKRLLYHYPMLINDIYMGDMYFGENALHMAIVLEDPALVMFLLSRGADVNQRCCGQFFCPNDQKSSLVGSPDQECFNVSVNTDYKGYTYWGESPLSFAACLRQEECVRLLLAKGADINFQDSNGNTALHMLVIYDLRDMFSLLHEHGAQLDIKNRQSLTPLTLAAKLARKEMYQYILEILRQDFWTYGNVTCAGYPLEQIDTIAITGEINQYSALHLIVYGDKEGHLEMMEGLIVYLLEEKWRTFIRMRFYRRLVIFVIYFLIFVAAFLMRPGRDLQPTVTEKNITENGNITLLRKTAVDPCYLMKPYRAQDIARFVMEIITYLGACTYILLAVREVYHQKPRIFFTTLKGAPTKALFLLSCIIVILLLPGRAACAYQYEDVMGVLAILCTAPYFLFFCRGFRIVGPFVVMIYKMICGDLLRFFIIYGIFVVGFAQAFFVAFLGATKSTVFSSGLETMLALLTMATGEFEDFVDEFKQSRHNDLINVVFFVYMVMATLLLVNLLIAMMANTYHRINNTQKEWFRQWAHIVLVIEHSVTAAHRREQQRAYSQPMNEDKQKRMLVSRWHMSGNETEQLNERKAHDLARDRKTYRKPAPRYLESTRV